MQGREFWERHFLRDFPEATRVWHAIVPTVLAAWAPPREFVLESIARDLSSSSMSAELYVETCLMRLSFTACSLCGAHVGGCRYNMFALRVIEAEDPECEIMLATIPAVICMGCISRGTERKNIRMIEIPPKGQEAICDRLIEFGTSMKNSEKLANLHGGQVWAAIQSAFDADHAGMMRALGRLHNVCTHCNKPKPRSRCSGCHFVRYCSTECSRADWPEHKEQCAIYREYHIFPAPHLASGPIYETKVLRNDFG